MTAPDPTRDRAVGIGFLFLTAACWGFTAVTVKQLSGEVDPFTISFYRVALATLVFVVLFARQRGDWRRLHWLLPWILLGALGRAGNYLLYSTGLTFTTANAATILAPVQTIGVVVLARLAIGERVSGKWPGVILSLLGVTLIWWNGQGWQALAVPQAVWGNTLLVLAGFASAVQFTSQRALSSRFSGLEILLPVFALSTAITLPFAWSAGGFAATYSPSTWALLLVLGLVLTGASFFFMAEGYRRCDAAFADLRSLHLRH